MPIYRMQSSLQNDSGLPRDQFVNSVYIEATSPTGADFIAWKDAAKAFYDSYGSYHSPLIAQNGHTTKIYQIGLPLESPPVYSATWNLLNNPPTAASYPLEVASCLSFRGDLHVGWNRQSTYGRIYLGPFNTSAAPATTNTPPTADAGLRNATTAGAAVFGGSINTANGKWVVYSKLHSAGTPVNLCWMNDEWDTVRSRGLRATAKTNQIIVQP